MIALRVEGRTVPYLTAEEARLVLDEVLRLRGLAAGTESNPYTKPLQNKPFVPWFDEKKGT